MEFLTILHSSIVKPESEADWENDTPKMARSRTPRIWRMAHTVVNRILNDSDIKPKSVIVATALGALDETTGYLDGVLKDGFGSPRSFIASVHNSMAGKIALDYKIEGTNLTVCDGQNSFASAVQTAMLLYENDNPILLVIVDEKTELLNNIIPYLSDTCKKYLDSNWEEAAVAFLLDASSKVSAPSISVAGPQPVRNQKPEEKCIEMSANLNNNGSIQLLPLSETSISFIKPAIRLYEILNNSEKGSFAIGSFSPSAQAAAVVSVCV